MWNKKKGFDISFKLEKTAPKGEPLFEQSTTKKEELWDAIDYYGERACGVPKTKIKRYKD